MPTHELLVATTNTHKLDEIRAIVAPLGFVAIGLDALGVDVEEPEEDGETFADNARLKAVHYALASGRMCLADDSGLEVDAIDGRPGVRSARYAGVGGTRGERDGANNELLLRELADVPDGKRTARFICAMCLAGADGAVLHETRGTMEGRIGHAPAGANGFGYDPLLFLDDVAMTSAELAPEAKNARSHRGAATRAMVEWLARAT